MAKKNMQLSISQQQIIDATCDNYAARANELNISSMPEPIRQLNNALFSEKGPALNVALTDYIQKIMQSIETGVFWKYFKRNISDSQEAETIVQGIVTAWETLLGTLETLFSANSIGYKKEDLTSVVSSYKLLQSACETAKQFIKDKALNKENIPKSLGTLVGKEDLDFILYITGVLSAVVGTSFELFVAQFFQDAAAVAQNKIDVVTAHTGNIKVGGKEIKQDIVFMDSNKAVDGYIYFVTENGNQFLRYSLSSGRFELKDQQGKWVEKTSSSINLQQYEYEAFSKQAYGISAKIAKNKTTFHGGYAAQSKLSAIRNSDKDNFKTIDFLAMQNPQIYMAYTQYLLSHDLENILGKNVIYLASPTRGITPVAEYLQAISDSRDIKKQLRFHNKVQGAKKDLDQHIWWPASVNIVGYAVEKILN